MLLELAATHLSEIDRQSRISSIELNNLVDR
jgi:hypothetical protein